jgi:hypothetical protein
MLFLLVSCGLEEGIPVLSIPEYVGAYDIDRLFRFRITEDNGCTDCEKTEPYFRGFEIYSRFFSDNIDIQSYNNFTTVNELESNTFKRISYYIDSENCDIPTRILKPLIYIPSENRGYRSLVTLDFSDMSDVHIRAENEDTQGLSSIRGQTELEIRRGIEDTDDPGYFKSFEDFKKTDLDVSGLASLLENRVYILIYVVSYGKFDLSETIYSETLCLGAFELDNITIIE